MIFINKKRSEAINVRAVDAAQVYKVNADPETNLYYGKAVISESLFSKWVRKHGTATNSRGMSEDFISMRFRYTAGELSTYKLRQMYYEDGATIPWKKYKKDGTLINMPPITYRMLYRSTGKAKEGSCIFVRESLHKKYRDYLTMGLWDKIPDASGAKIVELSAYAPLITATAADFIRIPIDSIFIAKDETVKSMRKACVVKYGEKVCKAEKYEPDWDAIEDMINQDGYTFYKKKQKEHPEWEYIFRTKADLKEHGYDPDIMPEKLAETKMVDGCYVDRNDPDINIENVLWDGMGLIDESMFPENREGFIYCRSHFFKSCLFRGNIQEYFKDYYGEDYVSAYVTDMFGRSLKVSDVKVIVTENSLKWLKFKEHMSQAGTLAAAFEYWSGWMKQNEEEFAIVKSAHSSKYGDYQRSSSQINNTLLTTDKEVLQRIAQPSIDYFNTLQTDDEAYIRFLEVESSARYSINNVLVDLYRQNKDVRYWEFFKDHRYKKVSTFKKNRLQQGKLFQAGDNLTICGNPVALLMKVVGKNLIEEGCFSLEDDAIQCYTERFAEGECLAGFRSPHNSPNNIVHLHNVHPKALQKYFPKFGKNVIVINGIGTDVQPRLSGQDLDSDVLYVTNQTDIVGLARRAYLEYPTIINAINPRAKSYTKSMEDFALMDASIAAGQQDVGESSNIAQLALSYWFDCGCNSKELEDVFIICSVLAQVAIDSAKRTYDVTVSKELNRIKQLRCMKHKPKYPTFYADILKYKDHKKPDDKQRIIKDEDVKIFNCPMDILYQIIEDGCIDRRKNKELNTKTIQTNGQFLAVNSSSTAANRHQVGKILEYVEKYDKAVFDLDDSLEGYAEALETEFKALMSELKNVKIKQETMEYLVTWAFKTDDKLCRNTLLIVLYDKNKEAFLKCFKKNSQI